MSDFQDAPWNKPVEEDGKELTSEDIPARRRKPEEHTHDPVTELLFSTVSFRKDFRGRAGEETPRTVGQAGPVDALSRELFSHEPVSTGAVETTEEYTGVPATPTEKEEEGVHVPAEPAGESALSPREALLDRMTEYDRRDRELALRLSAVPKKRALERIQERTATPSPTPATAPTHVRNVSSSPPAAGRIDGVRSVSPVLTTREAAAQENWFGAGISAPPSGGPPRLAQEGGSTGSRIQEFYTKPPHHQAGGGWRKQVALAALVTVVGIGIWGIFGSAGLPQSLAGLGRFFGASSFVVSDAEAADIFPPVFELYENAVTAQATYKDDASLKELTDALEEFFKSNGAFSWSHMFVPASTRAAGAQMAPRDLELLAQALEHKAAFEQRHTHTLDPSTHAVEDYVVWLGFVADIVSQDGRYLVLTGSADKLSATGGEPEYYALLLVRDKTVTVERTGAVADLNAALVTKIIPPQAVQVQKTGLDFYDATWFLSFEATGSLTQLMYEETTQESIDGVVMLSAQTRDSLLRTMESAVPSVGHEWVRELVRTLGAQSAGEWRDVSTVFSEALTRRGLQLYFDTEERMAFVRGNHAATGAAVTEDVLAVTARTWVGTDVDVSLVEYRPTFLNDGSVLGEARVHLKNTSVEPVRTYVKIYLPKESAVLEQRGYDARPSVPAFDYDEEGFINHDAVTTLNERRAEGTPQLDFFDESGLTAVGGWVTVPPGGMAVAALTHRPPLDLNGVNGGVYRVSVLPTGTTESVPFHFTASYGEDMRFEWQEPLGFVAAQTAEYQRTLTDRLILSAQVFYPNVSNK